MIIVLEGIDATGKSTLARLISAGLGLRIQGSEGPPRRPGEINERLARYAKQDNIIYDRHPAVSQLIYGKFRPSEPIDSHLISSFYNTSPLFIYCDPVNVYSPLANHVIGEHDTEHHLEQIKEKYDHILSDYREWAIKHAFLWYRIGDSSSRVISATLGAWRYEELNI